MKTYLFLIGGIALAIATIVLTVFWLRFAAAWSAGQAPSARYDGEDSVPDEHCSLHLHPSN